MVDTKYSNTQAFRNCFITLWEPGKEWYNLDTIPFELDYIFGIIWQIEKADASDGKEHMHAYIEFKKPFKIGGVKKLFERDDIHVERRKGTREQCMAYVTKEDTRIAGPYILGEMDKKKGQGRRTDLDEVFQMVKEGKSKREIYELCPKEYSMFNRSICIAKGMEDRQKPGVRRFLETMLIWGDTEVGKTRWTYDNYDNEKIFKINHEDKKEVWWDGYDGEEVLLLDEFDGQLGLRTLLSILDIYECRLPIKGGFTYAKWNTVVITSNKPIEEWWNGSYRPSQLKPLFRRIDVVWHMIGPEAIGAGSACARYSDCE